MPKLRNPGHEAFAQALFAGETQRRAYVLAGYKDGNAHGGRLAAHEDVIERVRELRAQERRALARRARYRPQALYEAYLDLAHVARGLGDARGAEQARLALQAAERLFFAPDPKTP